MNAGGPARLIPHVEELGRSLHRAWSARGLEMAAFPDLALRALQSHALGRRVNVQELLVWASGDHALPGLGERRAELATRSFALFQNEYFAIELLIWVDGPATLTGVFGALEILSGSSLHCVGRSEDEEEVAPGFFVGRTSRTRIDILGATSGLMLDAGDRHFHLLAHFECPLAAILVRAEVPSAVVRRIRYLSPCGTASLDEPPALRHRFDAFSTLRAFDEERFWDEWTVAAAGMDLPCLFLMLFRLCGERDRERTGVVLQAARALHGAKVDALLAVCEEHLRQGAVVTRWKRARGKDQAFLFATLLLGQDRRQVLEIMRARYPRRDPARALVTSIMELTRPDPNGTGANGLALPLNEVTTRVLELTVGGMGFKRLLRELRRDFTIDPGEEVLARQAHDYFREHPLFRNLCAKRRSRAR